MFLTNDFDDPLAGFDTSVYVPCLRTDDLVFHFEKPPTRLADAENDFDNRAVIHDGAVYDGHTVFREK